MITLESLGLGEILQKAGLNTLLGMGVVFVVLILISLLIYCMRFIPAAIDTLTGRNKKQAEPVSEPAADTVGMPVTRAAAPVSRPETTAASAEEEDLALIAVITAAVAAAADVPADGIVIRSIRRSAKNKWKHA